MGHFAVYAFISGLVLLASYIVYKWLLSAENQPGFNRIILLTIYVLSFAVFPLTEVISSADPYVAPDIALGEISAAITGNTANGSAASSFVVCLLWIYLTGMIATALWTVAVAIRIHRIIASGERHELEDCILVTVSRPGIAPFSYGRYVVMSIGEDPEGARMILCHERAHIACLHFADLLLAQVVCILLWYNPAAWLMLSELKSVHEYQADSHVLAGGVNCRQYQLLLIKKTVGVRFPSLANSLNHSKLKKRITMMQNQETASVRRTHALAIVPAIAFTLAMVNIPSVTNAFGHVADTSLDFMTAEIDSKVTNSQPSTQMPEQASSPAVDKKAECTPDKLPQFIGGEMELMRYLMDNVKYPAEAEKAGAQGRVVVHFTVQADGSISDVSVPDPIHPALDAEAIRVVKSMNGRWNAGESDGKKISCSYALPFSFKLKKDKKTK